MLYRFSVLSLVAVLAVGMSQAQQNESIRIRIDAEVDGEHIDMDTTITNLQAFDLSAYLRELGIAEDLGDFNTLDVRIREKQESPASDAIAQADSLLRALSIQLQQIEIPEMPEMPVIAGTMMFNGNKAFLGVVTKNTDNSRGVLVTEVVKESAADQAGLKEGDVITHINQMSVESVRNLIEIISGFNPNENIEIKYIRNGNEYNTQATLKENSGYFESQEWEDYGSRWEQWGRELEQNMEKWGEDASARWSIPAESERPFLGVILGNGETTVAGISAGSAAEKGGIQKGDVITALDGLPVLTYSDIADYIAGRRVGDRLDVTVVRNGVTLQIPVTLTARNNAFMFRLNDESLTSPFFFYHPGNGNCDAFGYEFKDGAGKKIELEIELGNEINEGGTGNVPLSPADIFFYPNPSTGLFQLQFTVNEPSEVVIQIRDTQGALVYEENLSNFSGSYDKSISLGSDAKGTYFVNVVSGDYIVTKQIVIQ